MIGYILRVYRNWFLTIKRHLIILVPVMVILPLLTKSNALSDIPSVMKFILNNTIETTAVLTGTVPGNLEEKDLFQISYKDLDDKVYYADIKLNIRNTFTSNGLTLVRIIYQKNNPKEVITEVRYDEILSIFGLAFTLLCVSIVCFLVLPWFLYEKENLKVLNSGIIIETEIKSISYSKISNFFLRDRSWCHLQVLVYNEYGEVIVCKGMPFMVNSLTGLVGYGIGSKIEVHLNDDRTLGIINIPQKI